MRAWTGPELAKFPDKVSGLVIAEFKARKLIDMPRFFKFIYNPSSAPLSVQEKAGCIIGKDYPLPILDEQKEKARCIARLKVAYELGYHGNSPEVLNGTAEAKLKARFKEKMGKDESDDEEEFTSASPKKRKNAPVENGPMDRFLSKKPKT